MLTLKEALKESGLEYSFWYDHAGRFMTHEVINEFGEVLFRKSVDNSAWASFEVRLKVWEIIRQYNPELLKDYNQR